MLGKRKTRTTNNLGRSRWWH